MANISEGDLVFESAAELFSVLLTPVRWKKIRAVSNGKRNFSGLLAQVDTI